MYTAFTVNAIEFVTALGSIFGFWMFIFLAAETVKAQSLVARAIYSLFASLGLLVGLNCIGMLAYVALNA